MIKEEVFKTHTKIIMRHWRIILFIWTIFLIVTSFLSTNTLLQSEKIHPLLLVLTILFPATFFLLMIIFTSSSSFAKIVVAISNRLLKNPSLIHNNNPYKMPLFSHYSWLIILLSIEISLVLNFSFKSYDFYLGTTIFTDYGLIQTLINGLNVIPHYLFNLTLSDEMIVHTFSNKLTQSDKSLWSWWIILSIFIYGFVPRVLVFIYTFFKMITFDRQISKNTITHSNAEIIEKRKVPHLLQREAKTKLYGNGSRTIALDYLKEMDKENIELLNETSDYQAFLNDIKNHPLHHLSIMIDADLMPDRSILRKVIKVSDYAYMVDIFFTFTKDGDELSAWTTLLTPLLLENEKIHYQKIYNN